LGLRGVLLFCFLGLSLPTDWFIYYFSFVRRASSPWNSLYSFSALNLTYRSYTLRSFEQLLRVPLLHVIWWPPQLAVGGSQSQAFGTFAHTRNAFCGWTVFVR
jgi:hypothetical protein